MCWPFCNKSPQSFENDIKCIETELSDFHNLTYTVLKQYFPKPKPKIVNYRDYTNFRNVEFRAELVKHDITISNTNISSTFL